MRMSTKGRFAVNALIDLALRDPAGPVALASVSARQQVSLSYLEQLFSKLRRMGLVESTRGPGGGYMLGRGAEKITVADIVLAVDDGLEGADSADDGLSKGLWMRLNAVMTKHMATITLKSLVDEQRALGVNVEPSPARKTLSSQPVNQPVHTSAPNSVFAFGRSFSG